MSLFVNYFSFLRFLRTALMSCYEYYLRLSHLHRDELFFSSFLHRHRLPSQLFDCPRLFLHWQLQKHNEYQCLRFADQVFALIRSSSSSSFRDVDGELCLMNILLVLLPSKFSVPVHQDRSYARDSCYQWHLVWQSDTHYMNQRLVTYSFMLETVGLTADADTCFRNVITVIHDGGSRISLRVYSNIHTYKSLISALG